MNSSVKQAIHFLTWLSMLALVWYLAMEVPRSDFNSNLLIYSLLFLGMWVLYKFAPNSENWLWIFIAGMAIRLSLLLATPEWSDDYARFLWDGQLVEAGQNPYAQIPEDWLNSNPEMIDSYLSQLFENLNSPSYYSVYPPLNQLIFWIAAKASNGMVWNGVIIIRLILILGEIGVFLLFLRLFEEFNIPLNRLWLYWSNPLILMEITVNLHFEGLVLLFLLASVLSLSRKKMALTGGFWGLSIGMKLLPLILAPGFIFFQAVRNKKFFWVGVILATLLSFGWLLTDRSYVNFFQSLKLYQGKFEFNASIYYLLREVGYWIEGYNTIYYLTKILSLATVISIFLFSWLRRPDSVIQLIDLWVLTYLVYLILQPVVHPWYLIPGFGLSLLTARRAFLIWSFSVIFSYQAYGNDNFTESPVYLFVEYLILSVGVYLDYFLKKEKLT
ncbi:glycosyltransferase 87 family protein [Algoriphagus sp. CAU 1675]|uniref:glycosyltransferase 87 family protein n=1 Tax=Algoriphagus sp. CAU 1675 TaxID=3032597 RepID=UPI0023DAFE48|nr:glycosyltransferase 87 family protein [Algoriphagus sp. CAU 1675]MDF2158435.1 glycosyltransferase 87 family protein [Algoriphagus sp. CAU 1675]